MQFCARQFAAAQRWPAGRRLACWATALRRNGLALGALATIVCWSATVARAWQDPLLHFDNVGALAGNDSFSLNMPQRLPPVAVGGTSAFMNSPLLVVARPEGVYTPDRFAQRVAAEPQPIRLPAPTFIEQPSSDPTAASGLNGASASSGELVLPGEGTSEGTLGLMTPPDGPKRRGFFARVFGPGVEAGGEMLTDIPFDYRNFYSPRSLLWLGAGIGVAAILANTPLDQHFQDWYQNDVRSTTTDKIEQDIAWLGHGGLMLPIWLGTSFVFTPFEEDYHAAHVIGTWGRKSTRAFVVGAPMLLALQYGLGAHRPSADINSYWHPFKDSHGASGDAWIGAISFLTAAKMTDSKLVKAAMWALALWPAWGRIDVNQHYLSQATLGVWLAALSVEAVDATDRNTNIFIIPSAGPGTMGATIGVKW